MKQPPEGGGQSGLRQRRVVLKGLSRRSDLNGRQAKVLSGVQSELIAVEVLPKYGSIFTELVTRTSISPAINRERSAARATGVRAVSLRGADRLCPPSRSCEEHLTCK